METIVIGGREITIKELDIKPAIAVNIDALNWINGILEAHKDWSKSTYELCLENPDLILDLISVSTGQKKKWLKKLKAREFDALVFMFLSVNAEFFIQRLKLINMAA